MRFHKLTPLFLVRPTVILSSSGAFAFLKSFNFIASATFSYHGTSIFSAIYYSFSLLLKSILQYFFDFPSDSIVKFGYLRDQAVLLNPKFDLTCILK